jgi:hypothetical protein
MELRDIQQSWLIRKVTPTKLSEDIFETIQREISPLPVPKAAQAYSEQASSKLLAIQLPGDEIWWFRSPDNYTTLQGGEGYALVRNGVVVDSVTTWIS